MTSEGRRQKAEGKAKGPGLLPFAFCLLPCRAGRAGPGARRRSRHRPSVRQPHTGSQARLDARGRGDPAHRRARRGGCAGDRARGTVAGLRSPAVAGTRHAQPRLDHQGRRGAGGVGGGERHDADGGRPADRARARRAARQRSAASGSGGRADRSPICSTCSDAWRSRFATRPRRPRSTNDRFAPSTPGVRVVREGARRRNAIHRARRFSSRR